MSSQELSGDDKKAIWNFVDVLAKIINKEQYDYDYAGVSGGPIQVSLDVLLIEYADKYGIDQMLIRESIRRYITDETKKGMI